MQSLVRHEEVSDGLVTYRVCPGTRGGGKVSPTRVPLDVSHAIMIRHAKLLDATSPLLPGRVFLGRVIKVEIEIPELQL